MKPFLPVTINPPESHHGFPYVPIYFGDERGPGQNWADVKGDRRAEVAVAIHRAVSFHDRLVEALRSCVRGMPHNPAQDNAVALLREIGEAP